MGASTETKHSLYLSPYPIDHTHIMCTTTITRFLPQGLQCPLRCQHSPVFWFYLSLPQHTCTFTRSQSRSIMHFFGLMPWMMHCTQILCSIAHHIGQDCEAVVPLSSGAGSAAFGGRCLKIFWVNMKWQETVLIVRRQQTGAKRLFNKLSPG